MTEQATSPVPEPATSPVIKKPEPAKEPGTFDFPEAIRRVIEGKKITKLEWENSGDYCLLKDTFLEIFTAKDGKFHAWTVSEGDLMGVDYIVIE